MKNIIPIERVESMILLIRGQKVLLDRDLANLYGVKVKVLNRLLRGILRDSHQISCSN